MVYPKVLTLNRSIRFFGGQYNNTVKGIYSFAYSVEIVISLLLALSFIFITCCMFDF